MYTLSGMCGVLSVPRSWVIWTRLCPAPKKQQAKRAHSLSLCAGGQRPFNDSGGRRRRPHIRLHQMDKWKFSLWRFTRVMFARAGARTRDARVLGSYMMQRRMRCPRLHIFDRRGQTPFLGVRFFLFSDSARLFVYYRVSLFVWKKSSLILKNYDRNNTAAGGTCLFGTRAQCAHWNFGCWCEPNNTQHILLNNLDIQVNVHIFKSQNLASSEREQNTLSVRLSNCVCPVLYT